MRNLGQSAWSPMANVTLVATNWTGVLTKSPLLACTPVKSSVAPGENQIFSIRFAVPETPGAYTLRFRWPRPPPGGVFGEPLDDRPHGRAAPLGRAVLDGLPVTPPAPSANNASSPKPPAGISGGGLAQSGRGGFAPVTGIRSPCFPAFPGGRSGSRVRRAPGCRLPAPRSRRRRFRSSGPAPCPSRRSAA